MNKVVLVGNLTRDPELRTTQSGLSVCSFTVAVQRRFANAQGVREADFISCVAWRQTAEFISRYFTKGSRIGVAGSLQTRTYEAQDGNKRYITEVQVDEAEFVTPRNQAEGGAAPRNNPAPFGGVNDGFTAVDDDDSLPF